MFMVKRDFLTNMLKNNPPLKKTGG